MKHIIVILSLTALMVSGFYCLAQSPADDPNDPHWIQTWGDEFSGSSLNTNLWRTEYGWGSCAYESALTSDGSNHLFQNGVVKLMTYEQDGTCSMWEGGSAPVPYLKPYTSGHLVSWNSFKYGYFEIRSRFPMNGSCGGSIPGIGQSGSNEKPTFCTGEGFSPTFWLFPCYTNATAGYVKYSEIDVYEIRGKENYYTCNIHYSDSDHYTLTNDGRYDSWWRFHEWDVTDYIFNINDGAYHTYAMKWDSLSIHFYYDGNPICHYYHPDNPDDVFVPCNLLPMNIIVANSAFSGNFGDSIKSNTILPYAYDIDYVRVSKLQCDNDRVITDIPDFSQYYYAVKKSISMGSATTFPTNTTTYLHATDFIEMRPGFEVSGTTQVKMIIDPPCHEETVFNYPWW